MAQDSRERRFAIRNEGTDVHCILDGGKEIPGTSGLSLRDAQAKLADLEKENNCGAYAEQQEQAAKDAAKAEAK